ncbi:MAG TPA: GTP cyclohydrolase I [Gemmatimonadales bacterium]
MTPVTQRPGATLGLHRVDTTVGSAREHAREDQGDEPELPAIAAAFRGFMAVLGLDVSDPNLAGSDHRVARAYRELFAGLRAGAEPKLRTFPNTEGYREMVAVTDIPFYSAETGVPGLTVAQVGGQFAAKKARDKKLWQVRLAAQMAELPEFDAVHREVRRALRQAAMSGS